MLLILFTQRHVISVSTWSRVYISPLLSVSRTAEFHPDARTHWHVRAHTHTDTCAHTQVSTLPPADREHPSENMLHQPPEKQIKISVFNTFSTRTAVTKAAHIVDNSVHVKFNVQFKKCSDVILTAVIKRNTWTSWFLYVFVSVAAAAAVCVCSKMCGH